MRDEEKARAQLIAELGEMRQRIATLEAVETERVRAEEALRDSEMRYRTLFQSANDAIFVMRGEHFLECNQATEAVFGCSHDDIVGSSLIQFSPPRQPDGSDSREKALTKIDAALAGTPHFFEWVHCQMDGTLFDAEVSLNRMSFGGEWLLLAIIRDVTKRKRAEEALRHYAERLQILLEIDQGILLEQRPDAIAQSAVSHIRQLHPSPRVDIYMFDLEANESVLLASDLDTETELVVGSRSSLDPWLDAIEAWQRGQVLVFTDLLSRGREAEIVYAEGIHRFCSMPLVVRGELIGSINFALDDPETFSTEHEDTLRLVADQLAIAIQQARLHEQVERHAEELGQRVASRTRELAVLYEVAALASQSLSLETTLARSLDQILEAMNSDAGAIHLLAETDAVPAPEALHLAVQQGLSADLLARIESMPYSQELAGRTTAHKEPLIVSDLASDPPLKAMPPTMGSLVYVGIPLRASGQILGMLSILRRTDKPSLNLEELSLLTSVADQLGNVVESARLRQQAERAAVLEERGRLARDLHDSITQLLYTVNLCAISGKRALEMDNRDVMAGSLDQLADAAQQALREMRLMLYELRTSVLEPEGLVGALQRRLDAVEGRVGVTTELLASQDIELPGLIEQELYHIALEALNNALKHARATEVTIAIDAVEDQIDMQIVDNGLGFDLSDLGTGHGLGLSTMRERAGKLDGLFAIESAPGEGTRVRVTVPYAGQDMAP